MFSGAIRRCPAVGDDERHAAIPSTRASADGVLVVRLALGDAAKDDEADDQQPEQGRDRDLVRAAVERVEE